MSETQAAVLDAPVAAGIEIALVDLSAISYPIYLTSASHPDPNHASQQIVARVRALTANHPKAAICCDKGKSFRAETDPTYKANRPPAEAALHHQIALAKEQLEADGYPVWAEKGYEADDLIATATRQALALDGVTVLVLSADKDLLQLVGPRVRMLRVTDGSMYDEAAVFAKFGVRPDQMRDYLTLVGDASDNIKGAKGIGAKRAADLLAEFGGLDAVYAAPLHEFKLMPSVRVSLEEFKPRFAQVRELVTLRTDAEIPFSDLDNERTAKDLPPMEDAMPESEVITGQVVIMDHAGTVQPSTPPAAEKPQPQPSQALVVQDVAAPAPAEWGKHLEPRSMREAIALAGHMHNAKMFNGYGSPQAVLSTIMAGRELGLQAVASLRGFHVVDGKHCLAADAIRGLVLRSGQAKFFRCTERTPERATFEAQRGDEPPLSLTYTMEDAQRAGLVKKGGGWEKHPADMLVARASSKLARLMFPDVVFGLYAPEEMEN